MLPYRTFGPLVVATAIFVVAMGGLVLRAHADGEDVCEETSLYERCFVAGTPTTFGSRLDFRARGRVEQYIAHLKDYCRTLDES